jgi:hypothetical protein
MMAGHELNHIAQLENLLKPAKALTWSPVTDSVKPLREVQQRRLPHVYN